MASAEKTRVIGYHYSFPSNGYFVKAGNGYEFAPAQWAFAEMLEKHPEHYRELAEFYQAKRDRFRTQLETTRFRPLPVPGGYFQLVDYSAISDLPDTEFCRWLTVEKGVAAIPLSPFYQSPPPGQRLARLCFAKNPATLDAAIERWQKA